MTIRFIDIDRATKDQLETLLIIFSTFILDVLIFTNGIAFILLFKRMAESKGKKVRRHYSEEEDFEILNTNDQNTSGDFGGNGNTPVKMKNRKRKEHDSKSTIDTIGLKRVLEASSKQVSINAVNFDLELEDEESNAGKSKISKFTKIPLTAALMTTQYNNSRDSMNSDVSGYTEADNPFQQYLMNMVQLNQMKPKPQQDL